MIDNALMEPIPEASCKLAPNCVKSTHSADFKPASAEIRLLFPSEFEETELGWVPKGGKKDASRDSFYKLHIVD